MMQAIPKVSVLMLTYNQERYIEKAIRSVMRQETDFPFELIIGNDASNDETGAICRAWQDNYLDRIVLLNNEQNVGFQQNFIQSYAHCRGTYVAICEGDDFWTNRHKLQRQVDFLDAHPDYSTCFHRVINYFQDKGTKSLSNGGQKEDTTILDLARSNYISNVSALFRRGLFGELPEWFSRVSTYDYAIHLLNAQYGKIHYMKTPMAVYRQHRSAIWSEAGTDKKLNIALQIRELLMAYFIENKEVYDALRGAYASIAISLIRYYSSAGKGSEELISETESRLLRYFPEWTVEELKAREKIPSLTTGQQLEKYTMLCLKQGRALVSRFIPLPRM
ncbi:glycosyltransferase [uncultured Bacteroides sp.]|uniref:glycosyltransferase n=1 Tax=uncultured Bacteroides sp. TaxID=162156 RepID=UPI002AA92C9E|nr:glycosyltransferase [uncultured Bacteroides sp.]